MNELTKKLCSPQYPTGDGVAVAEIIGGWGLSTCKMSPDHANIRQLKNIVLQMEELKSTRANMQVIYNRKNDSEAWFVPPSPPECRPSWTYAENRPLITFSTSAVHRIPVFKLKSVKNELKNPAPGREYFEQGTDKWYKSVPSGCFYQTTCCAPTTAEYSCTRPSY